jgi:hypothetical protein
MRLFFHKECEMNPIQIEGAWFKDETGRTLILRGVNLGGSSKVPHSPNGATYIRDGFFDHRNVSFVGRPFPLEEADEHFARLKAWGLTFLRFLVTWEAVEHEGPGIHDRGYLDYLRAVIEKANEHGMLVFIDSHQDVWSRFSGGDGAPGWTFEAAGMDITRLHETGAAFLHQIHGDPLPQMIWPTNATKLATATMFTLFFGGNDFAPQIKVQGEPIQEFLQRHYINAFKEVAETLRGLPNVVGYDAINEPGEGYIGIDNLMKMHTVVEKGAIPTPLQSMALGMGIPQEVGIWDIGFLGAKQIEKRTLNPNRERAWLEGFDCIWKQHGVWDVDSQGRPRLLRPHHFSEVNGRKVDFHRDYYVPFLNRFAGKIREMQPDAILFVEHGFRSHGPTWTENDAPNIVYAPHWYDGVVLILKSFNSFLNYDRDLKKLVVGAGNIRRSFARQMRNKKIHAEKHMGNVPVLLGEVGIAFDLNKKKAYRSGEFGEQIKALDRTLQALDENLLSYTLWNYTADNTNERGDLWNDEDLSIFSRDQQREPANIHSGGRALEAAVRPYPIATAGEPLQISFDVRTKEFLYRFRHDPAVTEPTLVFLSSFQYPKGCKVQVSDGEYKTNTQEQMLTYRHDPQYEIHTIRIKPAVN